MTIDPALLPHLAKTRLFLGLTKKEAKDNYAAIRPFYGRNKKGEFILDRYRKTTAAIISGPPFDWHDPRGMAFDEARFQVIEQAKNMAGVEAEPHFNNDLVFIIEYLADYGRRDLYTEDRGGRHGVLTPDVLVTYPYMDYDDMTILCLATAQMLGHEVEATIAHTALMSVHKKAVQDATTDDAADLFLLTRPLVEIVEQEFRNRGFDLMTGKVSRGIKHYNPSDYNMRVNKLERIKNNFLAFDTLQNDIRLVPKFPPPK